MSNSKFHSFGKRLSFQSHDIQGEKTKKPPKITTQLTSKTHRTSFGSGSGHSLNSNESSSPASRMCRRFSSLLSGGTTYDLRVLRTSLFSKHTSHDVDDNSSASSLDSDHASPSLTHFPVTPPSTTAHTAVTMSSSDVWYVHEDVWTISPSIPHIPCIAPNEPMHYTLHEDSIKYEVSTEAPLRTPVSQKAPMTPHHGLPQLQLAQQVTRILGSVMAQVDNEIEQEWELSRTALSQTLFSKPMVV